MSTTYRMRTNHHGVAQLTVIDFARKSGMRYFTPGDATLDRFTTIAQAAIEAPRPELSVELLKSGWGFGWEIRRYAVRVCSDCGCKTYEFQQEFWEAGTCFECELKRRAQEIADN